jgi:hypothetical protein
MIPHRRKRERSGIERAPKREWPRHRKFVRSHQCCVPGCLDKVVCAHLRTAANSGMRLKPGDWNCVPLCNRHHVEQEGRTESFGRKYGIDLWVIAVRLAERSPDQGMKQAMREAET